MFGSRYVGPHNIAVGCSESLRMETPIQIQLPTSHCYNLRGHVEYNIIDHWVRMDQE
jgi:hypothetical protein